MSASKYGTLAINIEVGNIHVTVFTPWNYRRPHPNCRISPSIAQTFTCVLMWKLVVNIAVGNLVTSLLYDEITVLLLGTCSAFYPQIKVKLHLFTISFTVGNKLTYSAQESIPIQRDSYEMDNLPR